MIKWENTELDCFPNIITYFETGKLTCNFINFMQSIQIEEITRRI